MSQRTFPDISDPEFTELENYFCRKAGHQLRKLRQERRLSQEALALEANLDQSLLSKIERHGIQLFSLNHLYRLAAILDATVEITLVPRSDALKYIEDSNN
jgi:transcriptional regulator with XRE-family HTH domain